MTHIDHHEMMQKIFEKNNSIKELDLIITSRQQRAAEAHAMGAYGTAKEQMLTASLARELKEFKENVAIAEKEAEKRRVFPNETSS